MQKVLTACVIAWMLVNVAVTVQAQEIQSQVTIDTSPLLNSPGYLDLQFNPGAGALDETVEITNFVLNGGTLAPTSIDTGGGDGTLPGTLKINNSGGFNDVFQGISFGTGFSFDATFTGPAITAPTNAFGGNTFVVALYATDQVTSLLTTDPNGSLLDIDTSTSGTASSTVFPDASGVLRGTATIATITPEPCIFTFVGSLGLVTISTLRRRSRGSRKV